MTISKNADNLKHAMRTLADKPPNGKAAMIEWLWPEIAAAIKNGHRLKAIWERLCANGLQMKHNEFRTYVSRMKKKFPQSEERRESAMAPALLQIAVDNNHRQCQRQLNPQRGRENI